MGFREVSVVEVREVLRGWLEGVGLRTVAERAGVDRKTARRYVAAAELEGLTRDAGVEALTDGLIGAVVAAGRRWRWPTCVVDREDRGASGPAGMRGAVPHVASVRGGAVRLPSQVHHDAHR